MQNNSMQIRALNYKGAVQMWPSLKAGLHYQSFCEVLREMTRCLTLSVPSNISCKSFKTLQNS